MSWENWIQFGLTFFAIIVALFGKEFVSWLKRLLLQLDFDINNKSFFHEIKFPLFKEGGHVQHYSKGINCLLKVSNLNRSKWFLQTETAKNVEVKITFIHKHDNIYTYHPTNLNWSGSGGVKQAQIISGSHHFLDFIQFLNYEDGFFIIAPNSPDGFQKSALGLMQCSPTLRQSTIRFEPWFVGEHTGIKRSFDIDGKYKIHFVVNGENCGPYSYVATIKWSKSEWDKPDIKITTAR